MKKIILLIAILFIVNGCSLERTKDYSIDENEYRIEIGNPYSPDSGHYAGYEWAESTGRACSGNSASFNEGCEEYYRQAQQ